jgi:drug/metabolite transporter (DMT)-like permease
VPAAGASSPAYFGLLIAVVGAVAFSGKAIVAKLLYRHGIDAVTLIGLRMLLSMPFFVAGALWTWSREPRLSVADGLRLAALGLLGYYVSSMLDFLGLQYISAGLERLILFLTPSFVLLLTVVVLRRKVSGLQWGALALAYIGIVLVFWHEVGTGSGSIVTGSLFVVAAAVTYSVYLLLSGEWVRRVGSLRLVSIAMTSSCVASLIQYAVLREPLSLFSQSSPVWALSVLNALACTVLPVFLTMAAVARIGAGMTAQAGMIGPVSTMFLGYWLLAEPIGRTQIAGTGLVLLGVGLLSYSRQGRTAA